MTPGKEITIANKGISSLAKKAGEVYKYLGLSIAMAAVGSYVGSGMVGFIANNMIWMIVLEFAALFGLMFAANKPGLNLFMMFVFTFMTGFTIAPTISYFLATDPGTLTTAFLSTAVAVGAASLYGMNAKEDLSTWYKYLFPILIVVLVASLINLFVGSSGFNFVISVVSAVLFTAYLVVDTQRVVNGNFDNPIIMAVSVYIDILNIFLAILNILSARD